MTVISSNSMTGLVRFIVARLDDESSALTRESRNRARRPDPDHTASELLHHRRAENESKRVVLAQAQHLLVLRDQPAEQPVRVAAGEILQAMAAVYADHRSYRSEWR